MARKKKEVVVEATPELEIVTPEVVEAEPAVLSEEVKHPDFAAELTIDRKFAYSEVGMEDVLKDYPENLGYIYYGYIHNDTAKHGNHPFKNGSFIHTSLVTSEEVVEGVTYIHTLNSTYKVRENAPESTTD